MNPMNTKLAAVIIVGLSILQTSAQIAEKKGQPHHTPTKPSEVKQGTPSFQNGPTPSFRPLRLLQRQGVRKIQGAFGVRIGQSLEEKLRPENSSTGPTEKTEIQINPPIPLSSAFEVKYFVSVTPVDWTVVEISAQCDLKSRVNAEKFIQRIKQLLRNKYGNLQQQALINENDLTRWILTNPSDSSMRIIIYTMDNLSTVMLKYVDSDLKMEMEGQLLEMEIGLINDSAL